MRCGLSLGVASSISLSANEQLAVSLYNSSLIFLSIKKAEFISCDWVDLSKERRAYWRKKANEMLVERMQELPDFIREEIEKDLDS